MSLFAELKRRNVIRMAVLYLVGAWLIAQVAETILPAFEVPNWVMRAIVIVLALGFVPVLAFAWVFEITPDGLRRDGEVEPAASIAPRTRHRMNRLLLALLVLAVVYFGIDKFVLAPPRQAAQLSAPAVEAKAAVPAANRKSIAVLAFADLSPGKDQEYFSDGMAEEILNALAQVKDLKVAGRTSSFSYKGRNVDLREIGKALGVAHILEGSVRKQDNRVRITAQLIQASDGSHLWSETFDGTDADVFALQEQVARKVADELKVALNLGAEGRLVNTGTQNPEAYALYLKATDIFNRRDGNRIPEALDWLEQAILLDPRYARAWSRLATMHMILPTYAAGHFSEREVQVNVHARRAIELDPRLAEPWAAMAMASSRSGKGLIESRQHFEKALQLDPDESTTNFWFGLTLISSGYLQAGVERIEHALAVDPMGPNLMRWRGVLLLRDGDVDGAEQLLKSARVAGLRLAGGELGEIAFRRGQVESARRLWLDGADPILRHLPPDAREGLAIALFGGHAAERARAVAVIDAYVRSDPEFIPGGMLLLLAQLGRGSQAMELERTRAILDNSVFMAFLFSPAGKPLRALPEFPGYLRAKGFPALWDRYGPPDMCRKSANGDYTCD